MLCSDSLGTVQLTESEAVQKKLGVPRTGSFQAFSSTPLAWIVPKTSSVNSIIFRHLNVKLVTICTAQVIIEPNVV